MHFVRSETVSYLHFVLRSTPARKTPIYDVLNYRGDNLGLVAFYPAWRKFVWEAQPKTILDVVCMQEIIKFIQLETEKRKSQL